MSYVTAPQSVRLYHPETFESHLVTDCDLCVDLLDRVDSDNFLKVSDAIAELRGTYSMTRDDRELSMSARNQLLKSIETHLKWLRSLTVDDVLVGTSN